MRRALRIRPDPAVAGGSDDRSGAIRKVIVGVSPGKIDPGAVREDRGRIPVNMEDGGTMSAHRLLGRVVAGSALLVAALIPGVASAASSAAQSTITLTVADRQISRSVVLHCEPVGGNHPRAELACADLMKVDGNLERLGSGRAGHCTKDARQVWATAVGTWRGRPIDYRATGANLCAFKHQTGAVFDF
ncbi:hypothetical protein GCM10009545_30110 [Saccharopolyspora thermophila]